MSTIDEIKDKMGEGLKTLKETAQDVAFNVERQAKIGKMRYIDLTRLQRAVQKAFSDMGEYVFDEFAAGRTVEKDDPLLVEHIRSIIEMRREMRHIEEDIAEIRHTQPPKQGG